MAAEISFAIDQFTTEEALDGFTIPDNVELVDVAEYDSYTLAKSFFDLKEYDRAAYFLKSCKNTACTFLHMYARYLSGDKKNLDNIPDSNGPSDVSNDYLCTLRMELQQQYKLYQLDGYSLYLYGVVLKKLDLLKDAIDVFVESIHKTPMNWSAWLELAVLITDKEMLNSLVLPDHWIKQMFLAHTYLELQMNEEALQLYETLSENGFSKSTYIIAQIAVAYNNLRDVDQAVETFGKLKEVDPFRLQNMDTYSNLLYVKEMKPELAYLAHSCCDINKYCVETCCVIGNYYSLRTQHEKAVLYFQRALKLNPNYLSAWTLMGHEYVEIKNTSAAIHAYRQAIEVNQRDYRAWYGLGQIYEILKMPLYCLYYFRRAQMLRPNDSRMIMALGEAYEKLERLQEAKKCFWKSKSIGDIEGMALIKLAQIYERLYEDEQAAAAYTEYINETEGQGMYQLKEQSLAYQYLAKYHIKRNNLDEAYLAAHKCTEFIETREEGKAHLRTISRMRRALGNDVRSSVDSDIDNRNAAATTVDRLQAPVLPSNGDSPQVALIPMNLKFTP